MTTPSPRHHLRVARALLAATLIAVLGVLLAGTASADPAAGGWMPQLPQQLNSSQKQMLTDLPSADDDSNPDLGDDARSKYRMIKCSEHRDFPGCQQYPSDEDSKNIDAVFYDRQSGQLAGVWAHTPSHLAPEHLGLLNDQGVLECASLRDKIPACSWPEGMKQAGDQARFDKTTGAQNGMADGSDEQQGQTTPDLSALSPSNAARELLGNWFAQACETVGKFAGDLLVASMTWWLKTDSIDVTSGGILAGQKPTQIVVMMILALGIIGSATAMALNRRPGPAAELAIGALKFILICSLSGIVLTGALHAADDFSKQITVAGADQFGPNVKTMLGINTIQNPGGVLILGLLAALLAFVQWLIGFARQAGLVVLFALLIFAAAGQVSSWGRQWFPRIVSMMIALILYKPFAACLYSIGFKLMGDEQSLSSLMVGIMTIGLTLLALPVMLKFFDFVSTGAGGGASASTALAGAGAIGATAASQFAGSGAGGDAQSNYMDSTGPGSTGTGPEADPSPGNSGGGGGFGEPSGGGGQGETGGAGGGVGGDSTPEADMSGGDMGPGAESPDAAGGPGAAAASGGGAADLAGMDTMGAGAGAGAEGAAAGGGAAAANPYVAGAMAAKAGVDAVGSTAEGMAGAATGDDDAGPSMT
ncbi:hypothetical protein LH935_28190 (plasmid) [Gordonia polyisoprenivorans]|uniref:hypothetical protein n=1 Tax=Gordonia polyisoprenivorans TaxID=84595 RepID=UPI002233E52E|nr:hypothetical protein [uncultured Gordonia sp.]UZF59381.1 hypothetical protein LH935_28190 [Gordonia polyisoprenivorans]